MAFGIRVFRTELGLSWRQARRAAKLFNTAPAKWPPQLAQRMREKSPSGVITSYPNDLAALIAEFVKSTQPE